MHNTYTRQASSVSIEQVKTRSGWSKKRKVYAAVILAVVVSVIAVAVAVPVVLTRRSRKQASYEELWLPQGYRGTGVNGVVEGSWQQNKTYDRLLV
jgi:hypothetical protein